MTKLTERALLWLHEQEVVTLGKGLTIFRQAMTVHLNRLGRPVHRKGFHPPGGSLHGADHPDPCDGGLCRKGLAAIEQALRLSEDYFVLERDAFLRRWMPGKGGEIRR
jgi:ATP-dependent DNA helicase RecQ